jgi:cytochrome c553
MKSPTISASHPERRADFAPSATLHCATSLFLPSHPSRIMKTEAASNARTSRSILRRAARAIAMAALLVSGVSAHAQDTPDLKERLAACAVCHGDHGQGAKGAEYYPHLAGKPAGYLLQQMQGFRDGRRHYPQMIYLMQYMDDAYLSQIAEWYAAQPAHASRAMEGTLTLDAATEARARKLIYEGDAEKGLPACASCHGDALTGLEPGVPSLLSLPPDYIIAQIGGWVAGVRKSVEPDCMAQIARKLDPADTRLLANWLSHQSSSAGARPAAAGSRTLPMACGDLPHDPSTARTSGTQDEVTK